MNLTCSKQCVWRWVAAVSRVLKQVDTVLQVFQKIKALLEEKTREKKPCVEWKFLGRRVCQRSFQELQGIGDWGLFRAVLNQLFFKKFVDLLTIS